MIDRIRKVLGRDGDGQWELPTSMMDVVFLLLIFFMCASQFRTQEQRLDALLPKNEGPRDRPAPVTPPPEEVVVRVGSSGTSASVPQFQILRWVSHDPNELVVRLRQLPRTGGYRIVLDGEANCPFQHLMSALDACARAQLTNVSFMPPRVVDSG